MSTRSLFNYPPLNYIIFLSVFVRLTALFFYPDINNINLYEYGEIAANLHNGYGYSIHYFQNENHISNSTSSEDIYPSAYMPPGYVYIVYLFSFFTNPLVVKILLLLFNVLVSIFILIFLFKLSDSLFSKQTAVISVLIYAILPEFIFANLSLTPTTVFHLSVLLILIYTQKSYESGNKKDALKLGIIFGISILFRFELMLLLFLLLIIFLTKKKVVTAAVILSISILFLIPWISRNYITFHKIIPTTTSIGQNLYRGHNPYKIGVWADEKIVEEINSFKGDSQLEVRINNMFINYSLDFILHNPEQEIVNSARKIFHLWIVNPIDERSFNLLYLIPWFLILIFVIIGINSCFNLEKQKFIFLFLIYFTITSVIFFALPRYQTMMKISLIPFASEGFVFLLKRFRLMYL